MRPFSPAIEQEGDGLASGHGRSSSFCLQDLRQGRGGQVFAPAQFVPPPDCFLVPGINRARCLQARTELTVGNEAATPRLHSGDEGRAVYLRGRRINRVMTLESDAITRHLPERRRQPRGHRFRPQTVHDHEHEMAFCRERFAGRRHSHAQGEKHQGREETRAHAWEE